MCIYIYVCVCIAVCCSVYFSAQKIAIEVDENMRTYFIVCCSVLQCVAVCCSVCQCVAVCFSVLQCVAVCAYVPER